MTTKKFIAELKLRQKEMAKLRDALQELSSNVEDEAQRAEDAYDSLTYCIERLSETV
jgi:hypothetical protein